MTEMDRTYGEPCRCCGHWRDYWIDVGEPDVAARHAEYRLDEYAESCGPSVDEWDYQRRIPIAEIGGTTRIDEWMPDARGILRVVASVSLA